MDRFQCLMDLIPVSSHGVYQSKRRGVEEPFAVNQKYLVFPEVLKGQVTGFYVYSEKSAVYYDAVQDGGVKVIADLKAESSHKVFRLIAQPNGLETVTIHYLPGFDPNDTNKEGPVVLGASVLPVVGAFVSRPEQRKITYYDPSQSDAHVLKNWVYRHSSGRRPADAGAVKIEHEILHLTTLHAKTSAELMAPFDRELILRQQWIRTHNLDEETFKAMTHAMQTSCKN